MQTEPHTDVTHPRPDSARESAGPPAGTSRRRFLTASGAVLAGLFEGSTLLTGAGAAAASGRVALRSGNGAEC